MLSKVQTERKPSFSVIICGELQDKLEMRDEMPSYIVNAVAVKGRYLARCGKYFNMASYIYIFCHFYRIYRPVD